MQRLRGALVGCLLLLLAERCGWQVMWPTLLLSLLPLLAVAVARRWGRLRLLLLLQVCWVQVVLLLLLVCLALLLICLLLVCLLLVC